MNGFSYYNPIRVEFGDDKLALLGELCAGKRTMVVFGGASARATGTLDEVLGILRGAGAEPIEHGGVTICDMDSLKAGIDHARTEAAQVVVGLGGAMCMDLAKGVAVGVVHDDWRERFTAGTPLAADEGQLSVIEVPTYPSTGSEADPVGDIVGPFGGIEGVWPTASLICPRLTASLDARNTALSVLVTLTQVTASVVGDENAFSRALGTAALRAVIAAERTLRSDPGDRDARGDIMWASYLSTSGQLGLGTKADWRWSIYSAGRLGRLLHGVMYRDGQAVALPRWLAFAAREHPEEMHTLFTEGYGLDATKDTAALARDAYELMLDIARAGGAPLTWRAFGDEPDDEQIREAVSQVSSRAFTPERYTELARACYREEFPFV